MIKVGVIGVGSISGEHIRPYLANNDVDLVAFCDLNEDRLTQKGKQYGVEQLYTDYHELLANQEIDAVSVCTWNNTQDRKSTRLNSSHVAISYAVFCLKKKK